jgi:molybdate transport system substrate-binding protein
MVASPRIERLHERVEGNQSMYRPRKAIIRNAFGLLILIANFMVPSSTARADEPYALVTIGMHRVFDRVMPAFEAASGRRFRIEYASTIEIAQRIIGGERADFVVASRAGIDRLISAQKVIEGNDFDLGGSAIVIAVPKGRRAPDISSVEGMKNALLAAKTVSYTDPASGGPSGVHLARVLDRLGISGQVNAKTRFPPAGGLVGDILARGEADLGIQQSVELTSYPGVDVVGPLPREMQIVTDYLAAIPKESVNPDAGKSLVNFLRSPEGVRFLREGGLDPK